MKKETVASFRKIVWAYYRKYGRHGLPWRKTADPYKILVSEIMLQQTQVDRVVAKYRVFLKAFPNVRALAQASNQDVLKLWSGLGYNRRALFLKRAAETVVRDFGGKFPESAEGLRVLPGVGPYTAAAVASFAWNLPEPLIETNVRAAFIHAFFPRAKSVPDAKLMPLIEEALDAKRPREWHWALMDYGAHLKRTLPNPSRRSTHHARQSAFKGSVRELRGAFLRELTEKGSMPKAKLLAPYAAEDKDRAEKALAGLVKDGILSVGSKGRISIVV